MDAFDQAFFYQGVDRLADGAACYLVLVLLAGVLLPPINEVPEQFPAVVLWNFRVASIGAQFIMWATLGLLFGGLTQRALDGNGLRA